MKALHLIIHGRVQGVGYRQWLQQTASLHELHGWVRNLTDGTVEALLCGPEAGQTACLTACYAGPPMADVTKIDAQPYAAPILPEFAINSPGFAIKQTVQPTRQKPGDCL